MKTSEYSLFIKNYFFTIILLLIVDFPVFSQKAEIVNKELLRKMAFAIDEQIYPNIHSVLIHYKGDLVFEEYYTGKDEAWGTDLGVVEHTENTLHDLRSVTKSIVSVCVGIAIQKGYIDNVDEKVFTYFPEYRHLNNLQTLTIRHLLTMTSGLKWNEDLPYTDPMNSEIAMLNSDDPIRFVLSQPSREIPGTVWNYNGGTTELLAAIVHKATGMNIEEFAVACLFEPLGIENYYWTKAPGHNIPVAASGLRMLPADMLKIGIMLLNNGVFNGIEIVSKQWIEESFTAHIKRGNNSSYGYQFWIDPSPEGTDSHVIIAAIGNGDQRIYIDKQKQLVVVITAGNYNLWNVEKGSFQLLTDFIYPALK
jgi:CubicO group peptidase (beta-lactamase class C family)